MNSALVLIVENEHNCGEFNRPEPLVEELKLCVNSWRKYHSDIPIVAICPSDKGIKSDLVQALDIEYYQLNIKQNHSCGYYNIPLGLSWAEDNLKYDYFIHIDLDMILVRPLNLEELQRDKIYIGRLNDKEKKPNHLLMNIEYTFESNFICLHKEHGFLKRWQEVTVELYKRLDNQQNEFYPEIEEFAIDYIYQNDNYPIVDLVDYQVGARYPLKNINKPNQVKFHHNHIYEPKEEFIKWKLLTR